MKSATIRSNAALAIACAALVAAVGGTAYAAVKITSGDVKNASLRGVDLAPDTLRGSERGPV